MKISSIYKNLLLIFILLVFASCNRDFETDIINEVPPALEVVVTDHLSSRLAGATVSLYNTEEAWNTEAAPVVSRQTDASGIVVFTRDELKQPGFFYLITSDGTKKLKLKTKYILLSDGVTRVNVALI